MVLGGAFTPVLNGRYSMFVLLSGPSACWPMGAVKCLEGEGLRHGNSHSLDHCVYLKCSPWASVLPAGMLALDIPPLPRAPS